MVFMDRKMISLVGKKMAWAGFAMLLFFGHLGAAAASGFRITNQSLGAVGLSGAHIAFTPGPDANYYNPANISFLPDQWQVETSLTILELPSIEYTDNRGAVFNGTSDEELFFMPLLHLTSPRFGNLRYGFSLTYPFGLTKQWPQPYPRAFAEKFSLITVEANPSLAYEVNDWLSIGGGLRAVYAQGEVDNEIGGLLSPVTLRRSSEGSDTQLGYNLALSLRPSGQWFVAATYRSEINLDVDGDTNLLAHAGSVPVGFYSGRGAVGISLPAILSLATAWTFDRLTVEIGWDRTFWSSFKELDFVYAQSFQATPFAVFDNAIVKNWVDADAYRLGLTYNWNERWLTTLGFAYEKNPVPASTLGFELPDADAQVYSTGIRYRYSPATELGLSYMYYRTQTRTVHALIDGNLSGINGTFTEGGAHALTLGVIVTF